MNDVVVVGCGIVGMACALAATRAGRRVLVLDKDERCVGASIRNFGFITVTGQGRGDTWRRARRSKDIWREIAPLAGIEVIQEGLLVLAQRQEAMAVLQQLCAQAEGEGLTLLTPQALASRYPSLAPTGMCGGLFSPHEIRVEARLAIGQLRQWLQTQGVEFRSGLTASLGADFQLRVNGAPLAHRHLVLALGADLHTIVPGLAQEWGVRTCRLSMLRMRPPNGYVLPAPVMSDLSLVRYRGYAELSSCGDLLDRLEHEQAQHLAHGIHLIVVQSADGSLVVGDSHHYGNPVDPFASAQSETLILEEMQSVLRLPRYEVVERWVGYYPSGPKDAVVHALSDRCSVVSVTSGTGMSTAFALAEEWQEARL